MDDGQLRLRGDLDVVCWTSSNHLTWVLAVGLPSTLFSVIGIPLYAGYLLRRAKYTHGLDNVHAKRQLGFLYLGLEE